MQVICRKDLQYIHTWNREFYPEFYRGLLEYNNKIIETQNGQKM